MTSILTVPLSKGSSRTPGDRFLEDQNEKGEYRVRQVSKRTHYQFGLVWNNRPFEDVTHVNTFWNGIHELPFDYTWPLDNRVYRCNFILAPQWISATYGRFNITVTLQGYLK
jgi:hypothetical protein